MINRYLKHGLFGVSYQSNHMSGVKKPVYDTHDLLPPMLARSFRDLRFGFRKLQRLQFWLPRASWSLQVCLNCMFVGGF